MKKHQEDSSISAEHDLSRSEEIDFTHQTAAGDVGTSTFSVLSDVGEQDDLLSHQQKLSYDAWWHTYVKGTYDYFLEGEEKSEEDAMTLRGFSGEEMEAIQILEQTFHQPYEREALVSFFQRIDVVARLPRKWWSVLQVWLQDTNMHDSWRVVLEQKRELLDKEFFRHRETVLPEEVVPVIQDIVAEGCTQESFVQLVTQMNETWKVYSQSKHTPSMFGSYQAGLVRTMSQLLPWSEEQITQLQDADSHMMDPLAFDIMMRHMHDMYEQNPLWSDNALFRGDVMRKLICILNITGVKAEQIDQPSVFLRENVYAGLQQLPETITYATLRELFGSMDSLSDYTWSNDILRFVQTRDEIGRILCDYEELQGIQLMPEKREQKNELRVQVETLIGFFQQLSDEVKERGELEVAIVKSFGENKQDKIMKIGASMVGRSYDYKQKYRGNEFARFQKVKQEKTAVYAKIAAIDISLPFAKEQIYEILDGMFEVATFGDVAADIGEQRSVRQSRLLYFDGIGLLLGRIAARLGTILPRGERGLSGYISHVQSYVQDKLGEHHIPIAEGERESTLWQNIFIDHIYRDDPSILGWEGLVHHLPTWKRDMVHAYALACKLGSWACASALLEIDGTVNKHALRAFKQRESNNTEREKQRELSPGLQILIDQANERDHSFDIQWRRDTTWLQEHFTQEKLQFLQEYFDIIDAEDHRGDIIKLLRRKGDAGYQKIVNLYDLGSILETKLMPRIINESPFPKKEEQLQQFTVTGSVGGGGLLHYLAREQGVTKEQALQWIAWLGYDTDLNMVCTVANTMSRKGFSVHGKGAYIQTSAVHVAGEAGHVGVFAALVEICSRKREKVGLYEKISTYSSTQAMKNMAKDMAKNKMQGGSKDFSGLLGTYDGMVAKKGRSLVHMLATCKDTEKVANMVDTLLSTASNFFTTTHMQGNNRHIKSAPKKCVKYLSYTYDGFSGLQALALHGHTALVEDLMKTYDLDIWGDMNHRDVIHKIAASPLADKDTLEWFYHQAVLHAYGAKYPEKVTYYTPGSTVNGFSIQEDALGFRGGDAYDEKDPLFSYIYEINSQRLYELRDGGWHPSTLCVLPDDAFVQAVKTYNTAGISAGGETRASRDKERDLAEHILQHSDTAYSVSVYKNASYVRSAIMSGDPEKVTFVLSQGIYNPTAYQTMSYELSDIELALEQYSALDPSSGDMFAARQDMKRIIKLLREVGQSRYQKNVSDEVLEQVNTIVQQMKN